MVNKKYSVGERIKEFAHKNFGSISELARQMDKDPRYLLQYTSDRRKPHFELLKQLCNLGADLNFIITGKESKESATLKKITRLLKE